MRLMWLLLCSTLWLMPLSAQADDTRSVNFVIFMKSAPSFEYDPIMFGGFSEFITAMNGAELLLLSHSARSQNGDVLNLQQDVLRDQKNGKFSDIGINCQLSFHYQTVLKEVEYNVSGSCQIIAKFNGQPITLKAKIPQTELPDAAQGHDVWLEVYENKRSGIAFYANVSQH